MNSNDDKWIENIPASEIEKNPELFAMMLWRQLRGAKEDENPIIIAENLVARLAVFDTRHTPEVLTHRDVLNFNSPGWALYAIWKNCFNPNGAPNLSLAVQLAIISKIIDPHLDKIDRRNPADVLDRNMCIKNDYSELMRRKESTKMQICEILAKKYDVDVGTVREVCGLKVRKDRILGSKGRRSPEK